jgi:hypothetical protein
MSSKPASAAPARETELYTAAVAATRGAELRGAAMPYTSVNGNMYSFLDRNGVMAIRLDSQDYDAFRAAFAAVPHVHETGSVLKQYVAAPAALLADTGGAAVWISRSLECARTLKPKPTKQKPA